MLTRLETEIEERSSFINQIVGGAQDAGRDLLDSETELLATAKNRIEECERQLTTVSESRSASARAVRRVNEVDREFATMRAMTGKTGEVEYRSAGAYIYDLCKASSFQDARERLEVYHRTAAHEITSDIPGLLPTPIVGNVIDFVNGGRPIINFLGTSPITTSPFRRSKITQSTVVDLQGTNGAIADEKTELDSQKMTITSTTVNALTFGGYVNVSRQSIDWSDPNAMDVVVNNLAKQYRARTEEYVADFLAANNAADQTYPMDPTADELATAIFTAAGTVYSAVNGEGRLVLAIAPDRLADFGPLFAPYNPQNAQGVGFMASTFGQGVMGQISGIPVVMSSALDSGEAFLLSTAAVELYEQEIGMLQVVEPSVLGVQVAFGGYFVAFAAASGGVVPLVEGTA
jgi:HK97 family phage major capsid protein